LTEIYTADYQHGLTLTDEINLERKIWIIEIEDSQNHDLNEVDQVKLTELPNCLITS
jgi:hypothetical protein